MPKHSPPTTLADVRDQIRKGHYNGDLFQACKFLLDQYDILWKKYREIQNPQEYIVTHTVSEADREQH